MDSRPAVLEKPIAIRAEQVCTESTSLRLKQHSSKLSSGGYTITDASGDNAIITAEKKSSGWNSRRSFYDASGTRLFDLNYESKATSTWTIILPDQEDKPVGTIFHRSHGPEGDYVGIRFVDDTTDQESTLSVRAKFTLKKDAQCLTSKDVCVYYGDTLVVQTKMIKRYMSRIPFRDNEWDVHVAQGFDRSFAAAIAVYFAITLCEKPVMTKSEAVMSVVLPGGLVGAGVAAGMPASGMGGGGGGGGGDCGGGGGGGGC